ncbi:amidohydrolase family protein [Roseisalinus antarcticus]|uniref:Amidohydrolase n=1 Tax=Roseisalinus antarcticus TaxID=254357 RepID=A0A1Y5T1G6_9RHOB|nr:amidohydrolase family protein [Roseisalinus antarcticus]SLN53831.1 Amidohydrolase [Roseisalinus antarcticus]
MQLIDTHVHLLHRGNLGYSWTEGIPALAEGDFTTADYFALAGDAVSDALYMEMAVDGETGWMDEARLLCAMMRDGTERLSGVVASCRPERAEGFAAWVEDCTAMGVNGFRRVLHEEPDDLSTTETYRANVRRIGAAGLPYELCYNDRQLGIARDLALACPDMPLILNHCGVPRIADGAFNSWRKDLAALAEVPHVLCKMSGVTAYCAPGTDHAAAIAPYIDTVLECFGPARMVWGSDWPVVNLGAGLPDWIAISRQILGRLSPDEARLIARDTATEVYGLSR